MSALPTAAETQPAPRRVLLLGGVDPSGGAGLTADVRALERLGVHGLPIVTSWTVQNRFGFESLQPLEEGLWRPAFDAAAADGPLDAVKLGLLGSSSQVAEVVRALESLGGDVPLVVDPVLSATAGGYDGGCSVAAAYAEQLVGRASLFTPNLPEAAAIFAGDPIRAALDRGCAAVLLKGGHQTGDVLVDVLAAEGQTLRFEHPRLAVGPVHGTGCALASAAAGGLALGLSVADACRQAIGWLQRCLQQMGHGAADRPPRPLVMVPYDNSSAITGA